LSKRLLWRQRHRWKKYIKMNLREMGCKNVKWIVLAQDRIQWCVLYGNRDEASDSITIANLLNT